MLPIRSSFAAAIACLLLLAGTASAARTQPASYKADPPATARRSTMARPGAAHPAAPAGKKAGQRHATPVGASPAAAPVPPVAAVAAAPQLVSVTGLVFDAQGRPRPGVCVFPTTNTHLIAVTDAQGGFRLEVPAQTALSLQADYVGVGSSRITVNTNTTQPVHIVLGR